MHGDDNAGMLLRKTCVASCLVRRLCFPVLRRIVSSGVRTESDARCLMSKSMKDDLRVTFNLIVLIFETVPAVEVIYSQLMN